MKPTPSPWLTLGEVLRATGGRVLAAAPAGTAFTGAGIDSRRLAGGELFVPLSGTRSDGHDFVADALRGAAGGSLVAASRAVEGSWTAAGKPVIAVPDPLGALTALGRHCRERSGIPLVAVTGSNGKTTTKEMIAAVLGLSRRVLKNEGNLNNHIGVPLTLCRLRPEHEAAVLELAMSARGEIRALADICRPNVGVLTLAAAAHLATLKTVDEVALAKSELAEALPADGLLVVNADDPRLWALNRRRPLAVRSYALENREADLRPAAVSMTARGGSRFTLEDGTEVGLDLLGRHNVRNALAAVLVGDHFGVARAEAARALRALSPARHRLELLRSGGISILDDTYNANPASMREALLLLGGIGTDGARRAVLGDMLELGPDAERLHEETGRLVPAAAWLYVAGEFRDALARGARTAGVADARIRRFDSTAAMAAAVRADARPGDLVLVKASRGMRLEQVVEALAPGAHSEPEPLPAAERS
ncbi:MAG TPA: UDP-N-acetylmuramoyl-tripeptide--D-alanyl-D-alanine ligase [Candidatus Eisenbacteria bacterium]